LLSSELRLVGYERQRPPTRGGRGVDRLPCRTCFRSYRDLGRQTPGLGRAAHLGRHETSGGCTLIALHHCIDRAPLVIAANRDEFLDRPAEGPALREIAGGRIVAPRDVRAGGTWLGVNALGVFAALTNRRTSEPDPVRRSRGLLVLDALEAAT